MISTLVLSTLLQIAQAQEPGTNSIKDLPVDPPYPEVKMAQPPPEVDLYRKVFEKTIWQKSVSIKNGRRFIERVNTLEFFSQGTAQSDAPTRQISTDWLDSSGQSGQKLKKKHDVLYAREGLMKIFLGNEKNPELYTLMAPTAFGECLLPENASFPQDCYWKQ